MTIDDFQRKIDAAPPEALVELSYHHLKLAIEKYEKMPDKSQGVLDWMEEALAILKVSGSFMKVTPNNGG